MLLPDAPFTLLDPLVARLLIGAICIAAAIAAVRRLGLPIWWVLWAPLFEAVMHVGFDALMPLLLLSGAAPLAAVVKPYAAAALLTKPRALLVTAVLVASTIPILPWALFIVDLPVIAETFRAHDAGLSTWGNPIAMVLVGIAILATWSRSRLVLPAAFWPAAQFHYGAMALPLAAKVPVLAAFMALPVASAAPAGIIAFALLEVLGRRRLARRITRPRFGEGQLEARAL